MGNFQVTECLRAAPAPTTAPHGAPVHMEAPGKGLEPQSKNCFLWTPLTVSWAQENWKFSAKEYRAVVKIPLWGLCEADMHCQTEGRAGVMFQVTGILSHCGSRKGRSKLFPSKDTSMVMV